MLVDIQQHKPYNVLIIGDSCLDIYHYGSCERLSQEAPVPILKHIETKERSGMAFNVRDNFSALQVDTAIITNKKQIKKERFLDIKSKNHLLRFDSGENELLPSIAKDQITDYEVDFFDAVVLVDYNKGTLSPQICKFISQLCKDLNVPVFVDSKKTDLSCFENSIIKINDLEFSKVDKFPKKYELIVTRGSKGAEYKNVLYETEPVEVYDVCGAGDTFFASLVYRFLMTDDIVDSIEFANKCAKITVTKEGTYAPKLSEVLKQ